MIRRERHLEAVWSLLQQYPVVAIIGSRQVGKTTLAKDLTDRIDALPLSLIWKELPAL